LPCVSITLKALKPKETDFEPRALGEHIRKRRLELGLTQKDAAGRLGVNLWTVLNWEKGKTEPPVEVIQGIIEFLGYDPFPRPTNHSEQLAAVRRAMGWTVKEAARQLGVDGGTWARWEQTGIPWKRHQAMVEVFLRRLGRSAIAAIDP
jgi:transcriptional regulator with XRE-family HTH domain